MAAPLVATRACVCADKMRMSVLCVCLLVTSAQVLSQSCDVLYQHGVNAYLEERWQDCVDNMERALHDYRSMRQFTVDCRIKCQKQADNSPFMAPYDIEDLHFYEKVVRRTLCLLKCNKRDPKSGQNKIPKKVEKDFEDLKPYEYLQLCYFQKNMLQKAASAVFTFLVVNPDSEMMQHNLRFYTNLPEVDVNELVNFEARNYVSLYVHGSEAYNKKDYSAVVSYIEESLEDFLKGVEECRVYCEGPFDQGWFPDFISSIANHFTFCLKCKQDCLDKMNSLNGERHEDLLPSHYHFLQYAYYKVGDLRKACEAVASYLLFFPTDETMLNNKQFYLTLPKIEKHYFEPREEAVRFLQREEYENNLLNFVENEFVFSDFKGSKTMTGKEKKESTCKANGNSSYQSKAFWKEGRD